MANIPLINPIPGEKTSVLLRRILNDLKGDTVRLGSILYLLRRRSFGGVLIFLAALSLLPGISIFSGVAMLIPGIQMAAGFRAPFFPRFLRERRIQVAHLKRRGEQLVPWIEKIERYIKPRWLIVTVPPAATLIGIVVVCLAVTITLPLPFSNFLPAVSVLLLAFGLLERDGLVVMLGLLLSAISLAIGLAMAYLFLGTAIHFIDY